MITYSKFSIKHFGKLTSPRADQSTIWLTTTWFVGELCDYPSQQQLQHINRYNNKCKKNLLFRNNTILHTELQIHLQKLLVKIPVGWVDFYHRTNKKVYNDNENSTAVHTFLHIFLLLKHFCRFLGQQSVAKLAKFLNHCTGRLAPSNDLPQCVCSMHNNTQLLLSYIFRLGLRYASS